MADYYVQFKRGYSFDGSTVYEPFKVELISGLVNARKKASSWLNKNKTGMVVISEYVGPNKINKIGEAFWFSGKKAYVTKGNFYTLNRDGSIGDRKY